MHENKTSRMIDYLILNRSTWIQAAQLAEYLGVSTRQIRKYITTVNQDCGTFTLITSSKQGYRLDFDQYEKYRILQESQTIDTPEHRQDYIIQKLITTPSGYDIFNLADELYVSIPTIERDLKNIRRTLLRHELNIERSRDTIRLKGSEKDKRSMMSQLLCSDGYNSFVLSDKVQLLSFHYQLCEFRTAIHEILTQNNVFCNDYSLNDIALHLIIMIDRIRNQCELNDDIDLHPFENSVNYKTAMDISTYIQNEYCIVINKTEFYQLLLIISNNSTTLDVEQLSIDNLSQYVDSMYIMMTEDILTDIQNTYFIDAFDSSFKIKITLHIWGLFRRIENKKPARNPLTYQVKTTYPLIYDIAVHFAQQLRDKHKLSINEDEIAYLALHIGSYFENNARNQKRLSCMFVYVDYHNTQQVSVDRIQQIFNDKINICCIVPISHYRPDIRKVDMIISTINLDFPCRSVIISPFVTEKELNKLRTAIDEELHIKRKKALLSYLNNFICSSLFYKNRDFKDRDEIICAIGKDAEDLAYVEKGFIEDVFARERISSTVFGNVAVPHALSARAQKSFIAFAIFDEQIPWNETSVTMVVMLGISKDSGREFAEIFDYLVDILSEEKYVKRLNASADYEQFQKILITLIEERFH